MIIFIWSFILRVFNFNRLRVLSRTTPASPNTFSSRCDSFGLLELFIGRQLLLGFREFVQATDVILDAVVLWSIETHPVAVSKLEPRMDICNAPDLLRIVVILHPPAELLDLVGIRCLLPRGVDRAYLLDHINRSLLL